MFGDPFLHCDPQFKDLVERVKKLEEKVKRLENKDVKPESNPFGLDGGG